MTDLGQIERFPLRRLSALSRLGGRTLAGPHDNGQDAPRAVRRGEPQSRPIPAKICPLSGDARIAVCPGIVLSIELGQSYSAGA